MPEPTPKAIFKPRKGFNQQHYPTPPVLGHEVSCREDPAYHDFLKFNQAQYSAPYNRFQQQINGYHPRYHPAFNDPSVSWNQNFGYIPEQNPSMNNYYMPNVN